MPRVVDTEQRRSEIVMAVWAVIYQQGIEGVTYQAVAHEAGVSVGRVQHYFASKRDLVVAGAEQLVAWSTTAHDQAVARLEPDPYLLLTRVLTQPVPRDEGFRRGAAVWYAYLARAMVDPEIAEVVAPASRGAVSEAAALLRQTGLDDGAAETTATRLVALSNGLTQRVLVGSLPPEQAVEILQQEVARLR
ncbi:MAG: TetR/AcrR family transcriptional regulator [Actinomycetia bacterium]|nr:TetR/AcrR family transcriptional regulator [Actinomycetes bacterium]